MQDEQSVKARVQKLRQDAKAGGYRLNPDEAFVADLAAGLLANTGRYGIESCPCRLLTGAPEDNMDIVCPCVYRDDDLAEYGTCFCALYVTDEYDPGRQIPERRPPGGACSKAPKAGPIPAALAYPVYRCSVCGYLCANTHPPRVCPVCKAGRERFERFI